MCNSGYTVAPVACLWGIYLTVGFKGGIVWNTGHRTDSSDSFLNVNGLS